MLRILERSLKPSKTESWPARAPAAIPTNRAGEKTPPNKPKPIQSDVIIIFNISTVTNNSMVNWPAIMLFIAESPSPKISGTQIPTEPQIKAATNGLTLGEIAKDAGKVAAFLKDHINSIATNAKNGAKITKAGTILAKAGILKATSKLDAPGNKLVPKALAVTEATIIGAMARSEKWRSTASCANMTPAIGALNHADIAAATPHPK